MATQLTNAEKLALLRAAEKEENTGEQTDPTSPSTKPARATEEPTGAAESNK